MSILAKRISADVCEGPLGFPLRTEWARAVEALLKKQPKGKEWDYRRTSAPSMISEFVDGERADVSIITSSAVDRDGEIVLAEGVDLTSFRQNPVVTFGHRYDVLPVGRALWIKRDGDRLKAKTRYSERPMNWTGDWLPDAVWHMVRAGDLRGKSIGFLPLEGSPPTTEELNRHPEWGQVTWVYRKVLLLEYAVATVQSNPDALVEAVAKGTISRSTLTTISELGLAIPATLQTNPRIAAFDFANAFAHQLEMIDLPQWALDRIDQRLGRL